MIVLKLWYLPMNLITGLLLYIRLNLRDTSKQQLKYSASLVFQYLIALDYERLMIQIALLGHHIIYYKRQHDYDTVASIAHLLDDVCKHVVDLFLPVSLSYILLDDIFFDALIVGVSFFPLSDTYILHLILQKIFLPLVNYNLLIMPAQ